MRIDSPQRDSTHPVEQVDRPIAGPLGSWTRNPVLRTLASGPVGVTRSTAGPGAHQLSARRVDRTGRGPSEYPTAGPGWPNGRGRWRRRNAVPPPGIRPRDRAGAVAAGTLLVEPDQPRGPMPPTAPPSTTSAA